MRAVPRPALVLAPVALAAALVLAGCGSDEGGGGGAAATPVAGVTQVAATDNRTFDRPGTYLYRCTLHDGMDGRVVVTAS